ncbi:E3 ubiquitin-protein ligase TRIM38-like isoform X1 [Talpa occidentalis]|uniref:E3 ubiquitin-protein ligase TRIM38-like isoform X1 n=1 Tax=Talpa occidentalis TaxID=50954 RepID=UPI0023F68468|nr:E3 ubiquitin-protein ligase TRIM38-like isoform X1 [Talpa occidentalis]XP_054554350.1 E3 ubiquitin-protein ligase TRIM38-like isoform X1 [Talpa occidentalis]XP_054554351.1 E3 ubiquitin-protein ligase TRIM38-like isoform X1 [Talpa occidentalis]
MALATATKKMREEATCSICLELMTEPVSIHCGHSFCRRCIEGILENPRGTSSLREPQCPLCRAPFQRESLRSIKQLENLIQTVREIDSERLCEEHGERLHLFCKDDGQLICWRCECSPQHRGHSTALVEDVYPGYKEKLQEIVRKVKVVLDQCKNVELLRKDEIRQWEENIELRREEMQSDLQNLHNSLHEDERRLEKAKEQLLRRRQEGEASLVEQSLELESLMLKLERKCQESALNLLQSVKDTLERQPDVKLKTPEDLSLDPQTVYNGSELYFYLKKVFKFFRVCLSVISITDSLTTLRVSLNPETASSSTAELVRAKQRPNVGPDLAFH